MGHLKPGLYMEQGVCVCARACACMCARCMCVSAHVCAYVCLSVNEKEEGSCYPFGLALRSLFQTGVYATSTWDKN